MEICDADDGEDRPTASMRELVTEHIQDLVFHEFFDGRIIMWEMPEESLVRTTAIGKTGLHVQSNLSRKKRRQF